MTASRINKDYLDEMLSSMEAALKHARLLKYRMENYIKEFDTIFYTPNAINNIDKDINRKLNRLAKIIEVLSHINMDVKHYEHQFIEYYTLLEKKRN